MHTCTFFEAKLDDEQRYIIRYLVRKKTRQERFSEGYRSAADLPRTGRHGTLNSKNNVLKVQTLIDQNGRLTVRELASCLDLSVGNVHRIIHNQLGKRGVAARWIPRLLNKVQKQARVSAAQGFLQRLHSEGQQFLDRIVTVNKT